MQPSTPPRARRSHQTSQSKGLYTPKTPFGKKLDRAQQQYSPELLCKQAATVGIISPGPTPRHRSSKKLGDAFLISNTTTSRSLFPPTPSTIGSGRKKSAQGLLPSHHTQLSPVKHRRAQLEESPIPVQTKRKLIFEESEEEQEDLEDVVEDQLMKTPTGKIINDNLVEQWNAEKFEIDQDDEVFIRKKEFSNPFLSSDVKQKESASFHLKKNHNPNELILINKKGEKIIKPLDSDYKPRDLFGDLQKAANTTTKTNMDKNRSFTVYTDNENDNN